ncbi:hypothetical protein roselon_03313 [Roseibacterium elongatum DSM 19469]|uniref:DUF2953 domain-containing protein n=1 Tax=Roseicyclus elongatus DSM 19469 TaxID=1294273 RepID=W8S9B3_9RHOB|nr:DUF2953 domain-containing protein [Roseibacterium elongatum]AHM05571.1 hypothetical protein roselon_03313 [Roseibacterium elongatum DSM 19469]
MAVALGILAAVLGAAVLVILLPWHLRFRIRTSPAEFHAELRLLAGHAPAIPLTGGPKRDGQPPDKPKRAVPRRAAHHVGQARSLRGLGALVSGVISAFRVRNLDLVGRIGTGDPADTGVLWGCLAPFVYGPGQAMHRIEIVPDFATRIFDMTAAGTLAIRPDRLLGSGLRFAWVNRGMLFSKGAA